MRTGNEVIEWIHSLLPFGIKPGLKRMEWMLERLGHPENEIKVIHIGGTNGKGSTLSFMRHALEEAGYNVGTFTSPYIECFEERISFNGKPIDEQDLVATANRIRPLVEELKETNLGSPTEFEVITAIAFLYFGEMAKPDFVLLEVGLGGRLDSTNVVTPLLSVISSIGYDHMHILGETIEEITFEKAGIIKRGVPIVSGVSQKKAQEIIEGVAKKGDAPFFQLGTHFAQTLTTVEGKWQHFKYKSETKSLDELVIQMPGAHQRNNAAVATQALEWLEARGHIHLSIDELYKGLWKTTWIGRFEQMNDEPLVIIDGAHNKEGMEALANTLTVHFPNQKYRFLIAATKEKDMQILLKPFEQLEASFTFTSFDFFRAASSNELFDQANVRTKRSEPNWEKALMEEVKWCEENEVLVIAGSLYFISAVREKWHKTLTVHS
ncbi:dihydrofolate synthase [Halalkalibacter wakoensis JCM 9140]|uniref:Dihydrofolate synthase/folylpolyglutamate synthase n=1 Tax=Halalkalibacter wakoensis JCM 9140 TaxID=1236970 RepID=W4Q5Q6_9BACI|nr:folylpolyglutamate synthase/dihydrofolate synthase family protein [Halalkalibacter wakoensis]GAE27327.1 dihydrofolate synthase [Halalkalibacter wakoensis JCM 9140]